MRFFNTISIIFFSTVCLFFQACREEYIVEKTLKEHSIVEKLDVQSDWSFKVFSSPEKYIYDVTIYDRIGDTLRLIDIQISTKTTFPIYYSNEWFQYKGETFTYINSDSNLIRLNVFYDDTINKAIFSLSEDGSDQGTNCDDYSGSISLDKDLVDKISNKFLDESVHAIGLWRLIYNEDLYILGFSNDSMKIFRVEDSIINSTHLDGYQIRRNMYYANDNIDIRVIEVFEFHIKLQINNKIVWANRISYSPDI